VRFAEKRYGLTREIDTVLAAFDRVVSRGTTELVLVSDRKRAEANLRQSESKLRTSEEQWRDMFENNPTMYFMVDAGGLILAVNPFGARRQPGASVGP